MFSRRSCLIPVVTFFLASTSILFSNDFKNGRVLDGKLYHLGDDVIMHWPDISIQPEGTRLDVGFQSAVNPGEWTVSVVYWDLNSPAMVEVNGAACATLPPLQTRKEYFFVIPAASIHAGENVISFIPNPSDDCVLGKVTLFEGRYADVFDLATVKLSVSDTSSKTHTPARVTITSSNGLLQEIFFAPTNGTAVRKGIIYSRGSEIDVQLPAGIYDFYATRGMEWSKAVKTMELKKGKTHHVNLSIRREVDTRGFIASDSHIHTITFSGHGDATLEERLVTLAGEGVELAVATDHNHHTDYRPGQEKLALSRYFTSVVGNEVTTKLGHFNAFPLPVTGPTPNHKETNWMTLVNDIRSKGAQVVVLNHPRWPNPAANPFSVFGLNRSIGERKTATAFGFDAMELVNSSALLTNALYLFEDWFALLNYGEKITAVGTSDSHTVGSIVGQGRTYLRSSTDDPSRINIDEACASLRNGNSSISLGIFVDVKVEGRTMGQLVSVKAGGVNAKLRVAAPSWTQPRRILVYLNGRLVTEKPIEKKPGKSFDHTFAFNFPSPPLDAYLVFVVLGDGVKKPFWPTQDNYTLAATNPVYLDANNDGFYSSPRATAGLLLVAAGSDTTKLWKSIAKADDGVALQLLNLAESSFSSSGKLMFRKRIEQESSARPAFREYLSSVK